MGREFYESEPVFRDEVDECSRQFLAVLGVDVRDVLLARPDEASAAMLLDRTFMTQAALFTVELALARLWMSAGIVPSACIGHSIGEYVAACLSGVLTREDAIA